MFDVELLKQEALTDLIREFQPEGFRLLNSGVLPRQERVGQTISWDIVRPERDVDTFEGTLSPAGTRAMRVIGQRSAKLARTFKSIPIPGAVLIDLRRPGGDDRARVAEDTISDNSLSIAQLIDRQNEYMVARALQGSLEMTIDKMAHTVDYGFSANHQFTVGNDPDTQIPLAWDDESADVIDDIKKFKKRIAEDSGFQPTTVWCGVDVISALIKNDFVQAYFNSTEAGTEFLREGSISRFMGLNWVEYDGTYVDSNNVVQKFIPEGKLIVHPAPSKEWGFFAVGSDVVPTDDGRSIREVVGRFSYSRIAENPPGIALFGGEVRLPVIRIPDALVTAEVLS